MFRFLHTALIQKRSAAELLWSERWSIFNYYWQRQTGWSRCCTFQDLSMDFPSSSSCSKCFGVRITALPVPPPYFNRWVIKPPIEVNADVSILADDNRVGHISISTAESCVVVDLSASLITFHVTFHTVHNGSESCFSGDTVDKITFTSISSTLCTLIGENWKCSLSCFFFLPHK